MDNQQIVDALTVKLKQQESTIAALKQGNIQHMLVCMHQHCTTEKHVSWRVCTTECSENTSPCQLALCLSIPSVFHC
jgi:hypothetical protein